MPWTSDARQSKSTPACSSLPDSNCLSRLVLPGSALRPTQPGQSPQKCDTTRQLRAPAMDQVYFVYKPQAGASGSRFTSPTCLYRYGRFCYTGPVELATGVPSMEHLPSVMRYLQSIQGTIPYFTEFDAIPKHSPHSKSLATLNEALDFIKEELGSVEEVLAEYLETETWIAEEDVNLYFEFESRASYTLNVRGVLRAGALPLRLAGAAASHETPAAH